LSIGGQYKMANRSLAILGFALLAFLLTSWTQVLAQSAAINLSNNDGVSIQPQMAVSGDNVFAAWMDSTPGFFDIFVASSTDGGATFGDPINVSNTAEGFSSSPELAASGDNVHVMWQDTLPSNDIFVASSTDGGATFGDPINISNSGAPSAGQIAASGDNVHVVWMDSASGNPEIFVASSTDGGATFGAPVNVSNTTDGVSSSPQIALSAKGTIHIVWQDTLPSNDIFVASSTDGGATFGDPVNVSNSGTSSAPSIALAEDNFYVVWQDIVINDIFVASSTDGGATFGDPINISDNSGLSLSPVLATSQSDPSSVFVAWSDTTDSGDVFDVFFAASTDGGANFKAKNVSENPGISSSAQITVNSAGSVFLSWADNSLGNSNDEILLAGSDDGVTFGCAVNISNNPTSSGLPQLGSSPSSGSLYVMWQDLLDQGSFEVLLQSNVDPEAPSITIDSITNISPKWDLDTVEISGSVGNPADGDTVTVDWGDGTTTSDVPISGCIWGPVSHTYSPSAIASNPNEVTVDLVDDGGQKASSQPLQINVQKHPTTISLDSISSVREGSEVAVSGILTDSSSGQGIDDQSITFDGSGASGILDADVTDVDGIFDSSGIAPASSDGLFVQAHFAGNEFFDPSDSDFRTYDSVSESATQFNVTAGAFSHVELSGFSFNASLEFEDAVSDGELFVSECSSPDSARYTSLSMCLQISSAVEMAEGSAAILTASLEDKELPAGSTSADVDIFHEQGGSIVDITHSRDVPGETVSGVTTSFSKFIVGVALHSEKPPGAQRQQIFVGDDNIVSIRDISDLGNSSDTTTSSFDKKRYEFSSRPILTVVDQNGNLNEDEIDAVLAAVMSETSNPINIVITLTENGTDTGVFSGDFGLTNGETSSELGVVQIRQRDQLSAFYISGARAIADIDGVLESGVVQLSDFVVEEGICLKPIGGAINLEFLDIQLGPDGKITFTISYANANLRGFDPSSLRMAHKQDATWLDITLPDPDGHDFDAMTVTGETSTPGPFSLAVDFDDCSGGAGGGVSRPGTGLVLDFVASLAGRSSGGGGGTGSPSTPPEDSSSTQKSEAEEGTDVESQFTIEGDSTVAIVFEQVSSSGEVYLKELDETDLPEDAFSSTSAEGNAMEVDGSEAQTVSKLYDISTSSGFSYNGTLLVTLPYEEEGLNNASESNVRLMHFEEGGWEDTTIEVDTDANTVTGKLDSLSPVVVAAVEDGTFGDAYHENHPSSKIRTSEIALVDGFGNTIADVAPGQLPAGVTVDITSLQRIDQPYVVIAQVLDADGIVMNINLIASTLDRAQHTNTTLSLGNLAAGSYTVQIFVFDDISADVIEMLAPASSLTAVIPEG